MKLTIVRRPRLIATQESFMSPEQRDGILELLDAGVSIPDLVHWKSMLRERGPEKGDQLLDLEQLRLKSMDEHGIDMQVLSLNSPGVQMFASDKAVGIAATANDRLAAAIARHPTRFAGLATVAPQNPQAAAKEIDRAINSLKLKGLVINSHTNGEYLDEKKYWPILESAEACGAPIFIHPRVLAGEAVRPFLPYSLETAMWGFHTETGLHAIRLICSGVFERFPNLKIVLGHMGESIPFWLWRLDHVAGNGRIRPVLPLTPAAYFRRNFMITTSGMHWDAALRFCIEVMGADKIMFAIEYPHRSSEIAVKFIDKANISAEDRIKISSGNAEKLLGIDPAHA